MPAIESALLFAGEYLSNKEKLFAEGAATSTDVVDARLHLARLKVDRLQTAYRFTLLLAGLLELCGESAQFPEYSRQTGAAPIFVE